jgi:hypothetical protein
MRKKKLIRLTTTDLAAAALGADLATPAFADPELTAPSQSKQAGSTVAHNRGRDHEPHHREHVRRPADPAAPLISAPIPRPHQLGRHRRRRIELNRSDRPHQRALQHSHDGSFMRAFS